MNRIKELRKHFKMTQGDLANKVGVTNGSVSNWENGTFEPDKDMLIHLANIFNCSVDYLIGKSDIKKPLQEGEDPLKNYMFALWGDVESEIDEETIDDVRSYAEFVIARKRKRENDGNINPL